MADRDEFFNDTWRVYAHHPQDSDWTHSSYKPVGMLSCASDFWSIWNAAEPVIERTMLFVMREHIFPSWDDPACINGSIAAAMVTDTEAAPAFLEIAQRAVGETLLRDPVAWADVNGVSIGPKRASCVIKVWMATDEQNADRLRLPETVDSTTVRTQPCRAYIRASHKSA